MTVSLVLPIYNQLKAFEQGLVELHSFLLAKPWKTELIIVDDGSREQPAIQQLAADYQAVYLRNHINQGKGAAVKRGVLSATGDLVIFMDGDFPFALSAIDEMVAALQVAQLVIGDRNLAGSKFTEVSFFLRRWGSRLLSKIIKNYYLKGITDSQCGIKGFRADEAKLIFSRCTRERFCFDVEILYIAQLNNFTIHHIPVIVKPQKDSTVRLGKDAIRMLFSLIKIKWNHFNGHYKMPG